MNQTLQLKRRRKIIGKKVLCTSLVCIVGLIWLIPIFWVVLTSLRAEPGLATDTIFPKALTLENYKTLFTVKDSYLNFNQWFSNTLLVAFLNCIVSSLITLGTAYALARFKFKSRKTFMNISLVLGMFPGFMSMIAVYIILSQLHLINNPLALFVVYAAGSGLGFFTAKGFFETIPESLDEAAILDGATQWTIFRKIILPLSKPIIVYTAVTAFMAPWMDFILASMILTKTDSQTVAVGLYSLVNSQQGQYQYFTVFAAGCVIASIPTILLYVFLQRYLVSGIAQGSVK